MRYKIKYQENGKIKNKILESNNKEELKLDINFPNNIIEIKAINRDFRKFDFFIGLKNNKKEILEFLSQLSMMLNSNLNFSEAISLLNNDKQNSKLKEIIATINNAIKNGHPIDKSLEKYQNYLGDTVILFLKLGIENGNIKESMNSLVELLNEDINSSDKIKDVLRYPLILLLSLCVAIGMIFIYVIPNFEFIFDFLDEDIPVATKILLWMKNFIENYHILLLLFLMAVVLSFYYIYKLKKMVFDKILILHIPILSMVIRDYYLYRLFLAISVIVKSKYQFQLAILNSKNIVQNLYIKKIMDKILIDIKNGTNIATSFEKTKLFDDLTIKLLYTAQHTNEYEKILKDITSFHKMRFQKTLKVFSSTLEPIIVLIISLIVLWLVMAIMLPIWNMGDVIS
ncbi:MAG: type II secretion system F family protein [Campylobacterota bacterium]|nr:type II secretion system F family protein [Campylobacterota bacterium]